MAETTEIPQTVGEALIAEGNQAQADLLTQQGKDLTMDDIISIVNNVSWADLSVGALTDATITSLRNVSVMRLRNGQPVFPWNDEGFLARIEIEDEEGFELVY